MHLAAKPLVARRSFIYDSAKITSSRTPRLSRRDSRTKFRARSKASLAHSKRLVDIFSGKLVKRHPAHAMNNFAERDVVDVAIDKARVGRIAQRLSSEMFHCLIISAPLFA